jgi:hypothetical protein
MAAGHALLVELGKNDHLIAGFFHSRLHCHRNLVSFGQRKLTVAGGLFGSKHPAATSRLSHVPVLPSEPGVCGEFDDAFEIGFCLLG